MKNVIEVKPMPGYRLFLRFEDGAEGSICLTDLVPFEGVFEPLRDPAEFNRVSVNSELGSVEWPNGADLDPDVLYERLSEPDQAA